MKPMNHGLVVKADRKKKKKRKGNRSTVSRWSSQTENRCQNRKGIRFNHVKVVKSNRNETNLKNKYRKGNRPTVSRWSSQTKEKKTRKGNSKVISVEANHIGEVFPGSR